MLLTAEIPLAFVEIATELLLIFWITDERSSSPEFVILLTSLMAKEFMLILYILAEMEF